MSYQIKLHPKVVKFLRKNHPSMSDRINHKMRLLKKDPFTFLEHFEGEKCYKLRIGEYRALIDVDQSKRIIFVRVLDHRKRIYKR